MLARIEHTPSRRAVDAERGFLAELGGDCDLPAGAYALASEDGVRVEALLASLDGHVVLRDEASGPDPAAAGRSVARSLLDAHGGSALLA